LKSHICKITALVTACVASAALAAPSVSKPVRIMSIMLCTDSLLLDLVEPSRITSITYLSSSRSFSYLWPQAAHVPINHGLSEEVLAQRPDLILAGTYTTAGTRALLKRLGMPLLEVPPANDFEAIRRVTRMVGQAVGEPERAESLLARMDGTLLELSLTRPTQIIRVVSWDGGGSVPGEGTLFDAILRAAGGINIAAEPGTRGSYFGMERLLLARPDVLAYGAANRDRPSLRTDADQHPLLFKLYGNRRVTYPELLYSCGVPESADAARELRALLLQVMQRPGVPP
jgi:iron complex transport system substrate-binding protein